MKPVNKNAVTTLEALRARGRAMNPEKAWQFHLDKDGAWQAFNMERLFTNSLAGIVTYELWSVAHTFIQNYDLMNDPEVLFLRVKDTNTEQPAEWFPCEYRIDPLGFYQRPVELDGHGIPQRANLKQQKELAGMVNVWMENLVNQRYEVRAVVNSFTQQLFGWKIYQSTNEAVGEICK